MANNIFQVKRTSTSGRQPNTTGSYATNSQYISAGEFALNMADGILYSSNGSAVIEVGANNSALNTNGNITLTNNNKQLRFATVNTSAYAYFTQQSDDNFVFYTTNTAYGQRAVWSIFANSITSNLNFSVPVNFSANVGAITANGSTGSAGQLLASNGTATYWVSPGAASVNTAAQFTWSNLHTFQANVSFTGNGAGFTTNTGAIYFNSMTDANWKIGRNTGGTTKLYYTNNSLDIIAANSNLEGIAFGFTGNSYLETGYAGTFTRLPIYVGNASVNLAINSTAIVGNNITIASSNTAVFYNYNGQVNASAGQFLSNAYAALSGYGGNYLAFGQQTNFHQWIQSGYSSAATPAYYSIILNPLGGNVGIGNTAPADKLSVNGTTYLGGNVTATANVTVSGANLTVSTGVITGNGSGVTSVNAVSLGGYTFAAPPVIGSTTANGISLTYANVSGQVNTATFYATTSANVGANVQLTTTGLFVGNSTINSIINSTQLISNSVFFYPTNTALVTVANTSESSVYYDSTSHAMMIYADDPSTPLYVGQQQLARVVNKSGSTLTYGTPVYLSGVQGNRPTVSPAQANSTAFDVVGLVATKAGIANNAEGFVLTNGILQNVSTVAYTAGSILWLANTAGNLTGTQPSYPDYQTQVGQALNSTTNGKIYVNIQSNFLAPAPNSSILLWDGKNQTSSNNFTFDYSNNVLYVGNSTVNTVIGYSNTAGTTTFNQVAGNSNNSIDSVIYNANTSGNASADFAAYDSNGPSSANFIDMGINSPGWSNTLWTINGPSDGYLYTGNTNLSIGTAAVNYVNFFTGGTLAANERMRITATGNVGIGNTAPINLLSVNGTTYLGGIVSVVANVNPTTNNAVNLGNTINYFANVYANNIVATNVSGNGIGITTVNATNITTGTLPWAQAPTGTANTSANNSFTGNNTFGGTNTVFNSNVTFNGLSLNTANVYANGVLLVSNTAATSIATGATANGTTQGTAYPIVTSSVQFTTVTAGTGAILPTAVAGQRCFIANDGGNNLLLYPAVGGVIDQTSVNNPITIAPSGIWEGIALTSLNWTSVSPDIQGTSVYVNQSNGAVVLSVNQAYQFSWTNTQTFGANVTFSKGIIDSTGSQGSPGYVLTSNGSGNVYWAAAAAAGGGVNTANQYVFTNTQTFYSNTIVGNATFANTTLISYSGFSNPQSLTSGVLQTNASLNTVLVGPYTISTGNSLVITTGSRVVVI